MILNYCSRVLLFLALSLILAFSASAAAEYFVSISPEHQAIKMNEVAEYQLTIDNNMATAENFELYSPDVMWDVSTKPTSDRIMTIESGKSKTTTIELKPLYVNPGLYGVGLNVRVSGKNMLIKSFLMVSVNEINPPPGEYLPAVRSSIIMDKVIDPRENITIKVELENQNRRDIPEMDIRLRSNAINADYKTGLGPLEKKMIAITTHIDPLTQPQQDVIKALIFTIAGEKTYQYEAAPFEFEIIHYGGLVEGISDKKEFLKTTKTITLTNIGNGDAAEVYKLHKGFIERIFTSSSPNPEKIVENGTAYIGWEVSLKPYEKQTITVVISYRVPFGIICAIAAVIILYFILRSPIVVHKSATVLATKEGGISELKVLLLVKNRSRNPVKAISIIDKVSHIADVSREFEMGTLHPVRVLKHEKKGTLVKWEMAVLEGFEERVLAYKIKSRLSVLGDFKLPVAVVRFASKSGTERSTHSNSVTLVGA